MTIRLEILFGAAMQAALEDVARLRIEVFRAYPYLYDGDLAYEQEYLQSYRNSTRSIVVGAFDGANLVGASTGSPLVEHASDFSAAFRTSGVNLNDVFYCAESVLLQQFRGQGLGHRFFDAREAHARRLGFKKVAFCSVLRPLDHPMRPAAYRPLESFWYKRGYSPLPGAIAQFHWKDLGETVQSAKSLQFWIREL